MKKTAEQQLQDRKISHRQQLVKKLHTSYKVLKQHRHFKRKKMLAVGLSVSVILMILFYLAILKDLPTPDKLTAYNIEQTTKIFDRHHVLLYNIYAKENRTVVSLNTIPKYMRQATIAIEDKDFYKHQGINPVGGVLRALRDSIANRRLQGGSTITQQLVKSALLSPDRTIQRKIKEIILATWTEWKFSKDQILERYLNQVPYGGTYYGIESAAQGYFGKDAKDLTLAESALLAGLPAAPTAYSPFGNHPEYAKQRQTEVLRRMAEDGYISKKQAEEAKQEPLQFRRRTDENIKAPHFVMYVKDELVKKYGEDMVERGGLQITTTLDLSLQEFAEQTVASEVAKLKTLNVGNAAALVVRPPTGEILSMVGSKDYFASESGNYNVTTGIRQPGSSIKPLNYAIGLALKKITPATMFLDIPTCFGVPGQPSYCPHNYDYKFHGPVQTRFALGNSYNIPAVKMAALNGLETFVASASAFGISTFKDPSQYGLSITLGGGEVHMTDMAKAFGVFANAGIRKDLVSILKVEDSHGKKMYEYKDQNFSEKLEKLETPSHILINGPRVISPDVAFLISHILLDNNARSAAFGSDSLLRIPKHEAVSVKTGTTDDIKDNWTIGFTPNFLVAVWTGNNDSSPMNPYLTSGVTGAAPIWNKIMTKTLENQPDIWPKQPPTVVGKMVCVLNGLLAPTHTDGNTIPADQGGCDARYEYFQSDNLPPVSTVLKQPINIDKSTNKPAKEGQTDNIEQQQKIVLSDPFTKQYCFDCPHDGDQPMFTSVNPR